MTASDLVKKRTISKVRLNRAPTNQDLEVIEEEKGDKQKEKSGNSASNNLNQLNDMNLEKITLNNKAKSGIASSAFQNARMAQGSRNQDDTLS